MVPGETRGSDGSLGVAEMLTGADSAVIRRCSPAKSLPFSPWLQTGSRNGRTICGSGHPAHDRTFATSDQARRNRVAWRVAATSRVRDGITMTARVRGTGPCPS